MKHLHRIGPLFLVLFVTHPQIARGDDLLLFSYQGKPFYYKDFTGVSYDEVLAFAKVVEPKITNEERSQFRPGVSLYATRVFGVGKGERVTDTLLSSAVEGFIDSWIAHRCLQSFVEGKGIDQSKRFNLDLFYRNVRHEALYLQTLTKAGNAVRKKSCSIDEAYQKFELLKEFYTPQEWRKIWESGRATDFVESKIFTEFAFPFYSDREGQESYFRRLEAKNYVYSILLKDHVRDHEAEYVPIVEDIWGERDAIVFYGYSAGELANVRRIIADLTDSKGEVLVKKAEAFNKGKKEFGEFLYEVAKIADYPKKYVDYMLVSKHRASSSFDVPEGTISAGAPIRMGPKAKFAGGVAGEGFFYLSPTVRKPGLKDLGYDPYKNGFAWSIERAATLQPFYEDTLKQMTLKVPYTKKNVDTLIHLTTGFRPHRKLGHCIFSHPIILTEKDKETLEAFYSQARMLLETKKGPLGEFENAWKAGRYTDAVSISESFLKGGKTKPPRSYQATEDALRRLLCSM